MVEQRASVRPNKMNRGLSFGPVWSNSAEGALKPMSKNEEEMEARGLEEGRCRRVEGVLGKGEEIEREGDGRWRGCRGGGRGRCQREDERRRGCREEKKGQCRRKDERGKDGEGDGAEEETKGGKREGGDAGKKTREKGGGRE